MDMRSRPAHQSLFNNVPDRVSTPVRSTKAGGTSRLTHQIAPQP